MATVAGMGMVDPYFNGTLSIGKRHVMSSHISISKCSVLFQNWFCLHSNTASLV